MINAEKALFNSNFDKIEQKTIRKISIIRYFPDTFMGYGHRGLSAIAEKVGINIKKIEPGEFLIFVNKKQTALKLYTSGNIIAHLKMPGTEHIDLRTITLIPRFFNGTSIHYDKALREVFERHYSK